MTDISSVEFEHCRELVMSPGSLFEFTSKYVPADQLPPLLALYALRQVISAIPGGSLDESIKYTKLKWWNDELGADPDSPSRHPILRALSQSGARARLDNALLQQLIRDALFQVDASPDSDENALFERLSANGQTEIQLEIGLENAEINSQARAELAAATGMYRLVSSFAPNQRSETERLPLNMLAKYGLSITQIQDGSKPVEVSQVLAELAGRGLDWSFSGMKGANVSSGKGAEIRACAHLQLRWAMERRRLETIKKDAGSFIEKGKAFGPADAWFAWRFLRALKD